MLSVSNRRANYSLLKVYYGFLARLPPNSARLAITDSLCSFTDVKNPALCANTYLLFLALRELVPDGTGTSLIFNLDCVCPTLPLLFLVMR